MGFERALADGGTLCLDEDWLAQAEADELFFAMQAGVPWRQRRLWIAGREIPEPRLTAWFGDEEAAYSYSGIMLEPEPWSPALLRLRDRVADAVGGLFNSVLLNLYRTGEDSVGYHADAEPELGRDPVIASVSLGATRRFVLQHKKRKEIARVVLELRHGSLLVMGGTTQRFWRHMVPKQAAPVGPRINLTFRRIVPAAPTKVRDKGRKTG